MSDRQPRRRRGRANLSQAAHLYVHEGRSIRWLGRYYQADPRTIKEHLLRAGVELRQERSTRPDKRTRDDMVAAYEAGASITRLAGQHGLSRGMVQSCLEEAGVQLRGLREAIQVRDSSRRAATDIGAWVQAYQGGSSVRDIAARYGAGQDQVRDRLRAAGVLRSTRRPTGAQVAEWVRAHLDGETAEDITRTRGYGFTVGTVRHYLRDAGMLSGRAPRGRQGKPAGLTAEDIAGMVAAYEAGEGGDVIGTRYGVSDTTVYHHLRKAGVKIRSKREGILLARAREAQRGAAEAG